MGLSERLDAEAPLLATAFPDVELDITGRSLIIPSHPLAESWSLAKTPVLVQIPTGYPTTPPDNICVDAELRLRGGATPSNTMGIRDIAGRKWLQFSYHIEQADWRPHPDVAVSDTLVTYLTGALRRLEEAN